MKRLVGYGLLLVLTSLACAPRTHAQGACPSGSPLSGNHCYFISSSGGSDSNNGTSESTAWANAPKMSTCTGTCASTSYAPGEVFIFKGCDTWNFATIGRWTPGASGAAGNLIYFGGFDQTWYNASACPSGWNRPIFSGEGTYPGANGDWFMDMDEDNYWRAAWIEWTGLYWVGSGNNQEGGYLSGGVGDTGFEVDHNYFHGLTFNFPSSCTVSGDTYPCAESWAINMSSTAVSGEIDHNVFSGADATGTCASCYSTTHDFGLFLTGNFYYTRIDHNYFQYSDNCLVGTFEIVDDNTFNACGAFSAGANSIHNNVFESNADPTGGTLFYNNLIENSGTLGYAAVSQLAPPSGTTSYWFNNVTTNFLAGESGGQMLFSCSTPSGGGGGLCVNFNNTVECGPDSGTDSPPSLQCFVAGASPLTLDSYYNQFITSNSSPIQCYNNSCGLITQLPTSSLAQTLSVANGQGYSISTLFAPQNGSGATIQAGYSPSALITQCSAVAAVDTLGAGAGTACESSTTCGVSLTTSPYYNVGPSNCSPVARLTSGSTNNDAGAYQYSATTGTGPSSGAPQPPSGLVATVE